MFILSHSDIVCTHALTHSRTRKHTRRADWEEGLSWQDLCSLYGWLDSGEWVLPHSVSLSREAPCWDTAYGLLQHIGGEVEPGPNGKITRAKRSEVKQRSKVMVPHYNMIYIDWRTIIKQTGEINVQQLIERHYLYKKIKMLFISTSSSYTTFCVMKSQQK